MEEKKILIVNLSKGRMGEQNASLIGSMLITKIYLSAMSRADLLERELAKLPSFYFYVDEFQSFANESFAHILSEARKYKLNLTIAHQYVEQMPEEVRAAVFGNVGTMAVFRVGSFDAEIFEKEFGEVFTSEDIVSLGFAQIYLRLMIDGVGSHPFSAKTLPPIPRPSVSYKERIIDYTRTQYARPREAVEAEIEKWHLAEEAAPSKKQVPKSESSYISAVAAEKSTAQSVSLKKELPQAPMHAEFGKEHSGITLRQMAPVTMVERQKSGFPPRQTMLSQRPISRSVFRAATPMKQPLMKVSSVSRHESVSKNPLPQVVAKKQTEPQPVVMPLEKKTAPLHLASLKNGFGHKPQIDKSASPQNLKGLREALASALHKDIGTLKEKEKNATEALKEAGPLAPKVSISSEIKQPLPDAISKKEVPEDVLKKILEGSVE